ncbi:phytoene synthase [Neokomagataea thailandica NBRC 106555]|uniref:Squalene synthase HpnC n=2 Tax=Neokomagataea TaxID=1223423 RepID=A0A4Y6V6C2_9PROT|nr:MULTISPECIES: squalene/phytoene synthase family protein [Neokomagataea]QDH25589.1 squalene synthase HpnC [Neokomagataea tanensis]GBR52608.1 phytoene synthase [Neokomagataea thailandica NBRC 106555]
MSNDSIWGDKDVTSAKGKGDENFPVGSLLIAKRHRPVVYTYYNFARVTDDMVDTTELKPAEKIARLRGMASIIRGEVEAPLRADLQTAAKLRTALIERKIPLEVATDLTEAFCIDAEKNRYNTWEELLHYCRYSANPVGRFLLHLHGEIAEAFAPGDALSSALQVLNHIQDAADDLKILDRCYIPLPWLAEEGVTIDDLRLVRSKPGLRRVFNRLLDEVDALNREARILPHLIQDRRMRLEAAVIVQLSHALAHHLRFNDPIEGRVSLTKKDGLKALIFSSKYLL